MRVALSFLGCHRRGGVERIVLECARYLGGRGHKVDLLAGEFDQEDGVSVHYHHVPARRRPSFLHKYSFFRQSTQVLRTLDYDVLSTHGSVCPTGGVHWVQSVHRAWLERSRALRSPLSAARWRQRLNPLHPILLRLEEEHFRRRAYKKLIATTDEVKVDLVRLYGVPPETVEIIPNGFNPVEFSPERRAARRASERARLGLRPDDVALLLVANELERKGYSTILDAMRRLGRRDIRLIVVGRPAVDAVQAQAGRVGLGDQVLACGPTADVAGFHAAADVFVLPTQYEAFCLAILEALGSGLPVITTRVPGAQDAIQDGVNGLLIDNPNNGSELAGALEILLDPVRRATLSAQAPVSAVKYQWPSVLARYEDVLRRHAT